MSGRATLNTHHAIKLVAVLAMTIDHVGVCLYPDELWWRAIGRIASVIFFFLVGHAQSYDSSRALVWWALAMAAISPLLGKPVFPLNVLVTILLCRQLLTMVEKKNLLAREPVMIIVAATVFFPVSAFFMEYGSLGFLYALMGYAVRSNQMDWRRGKLVMLVVLTAFVIGHCVSKPYSVEQMLFIALATTAVTLYLSRFRHRPIAWASPAARPLLWLSRHSMQYYVVHRLVLQAVGLMTGALKAGFRWI